MIAEERRQAIPEAGPQRSVALRFAPSLYTVALIVVLGAVLTLALAPRLDGDFWWHLSAGAYMVSYHAVPTHDFLSFTALGRPWLDHEWLTQLIMYELYQAAGLWGPLAFFAIIITASFWLVYVQMMQLRINRLLSLFVVAAAAIASFASWGPRAQIVSLLFLAVYALVLGRFEATHDRRLLFAFPLVMLAWVNMHGGFVLGILLLFLTLVGEWLNRITNRENALSERDFKSLAIALVATIAVTLINPNGLSEPLYPLSWIFPSLYANSIAEWGSPDFHTSVFMVFEGLILLLIASVFVARPRVNWTHLLLVVVFTHLALSEERNVPVWSIVISPLVALYAQKAALTLRERFPGVTYRRRPVRGSLAPLLNLTLLALACIFYVAVASHYVTPGAPTADEKQNFPYRAVSYLQAHSLPPHVFASYSWGGYLTWRLHPRYQDFIDGRANTLFSSATLADYLSAYAASPQWQSIFKRYGVQDVLVEAGSPLARVLGENPGWRLAYQDGGAVLFTRQA